MFRQILLHAIPGQQQYDSLPTPKSNYSPWPLVSHIGLPPVLLLTSTHTMHIYKPHSPQMPQGVPNEEKKKNTFSPSNSVPLSQHLARITMSSTQQMFKSGEAHGQGEGKANQMMQSAKDTANSAQQKMSNAAESTTQSAQQGKESTAGFLQQTGEQMMNMAQGAVDSVKNTLGVGDNQPKK